MNRKSRLTENKLCYKFENYIIQVSLASALKNGKFNSI